MIDITTFNAVFSMFIGAVFIGIPLALIGDEIDNN